MTFRKNLKRICPICGTTNGNVLYHIDMFMPKEYQIASEYDVVACCGCGFVFADVEANQEIYNEYYRNHNSYAESNNLISETSAELNANRIKLLTKYVDKKAKILDIGFGRGDLLCSLREEGYTDLYGIDPSAESVNRLTEKYDIPTKCANLFDEAGELAGKFDVVCCMAVAEHIYDLENYISKLIAYTKDDGLIMVDMPDADTFLSCPHDIPCYFNHEHINYFNIASIENLFGKNGFVRVNTDEEAHTFITENNFGKNDKGKEGVLQILFHHNNSKAKEIRADFSLETLLREYFSNAELLERERVSRAKDFLAQSDDKIYIWGAGAMAMQVFMIMPEIKDRVCGIIDNNSTKWGTTLAGYEIVGSQYLIDKGANNPILICVMNNSDSVITQINDMGICNPYLVF